MQENTYKDCIHAGGSYLNTLLKLDNLSRLRNNDSEKVLRANQAS